ncbi:unnamed protein product, partial [Brassica napus]
MPEVLAAVVAVEIKSSFVFVVEIDKSNGLFCIELIRCFFIN